MNTVVTIKALAADAANTGDPTRILVLHDAVLGVLAGVDIRWFDRSVKHGSWRNVRILAGFIERVFCGDC